MGRHKKNEARKIKGSFTPLVWSTMDTPAWLSLSAYAKALYPVLKRVAFKHGNGNACLSVRQAAEYLNIGKNRAAEVFHELQSRGFIAAVEIGSLGVEGKGRSTRWRLTELDWNGQAASVEFRLWQPGQDLHVARGTAPKIQNPVPLTGTSCPSQRDV